MTGARDVEHTTVYYDAGYYAGWPGVGIAEAEQQIDIGAPGADAVQRGERGVGLVGLHASDGLKIDGALCDRGTDRLQRLDLRPR